MLFREVGTNDVLFYISLVLVYPLLYIPRALEKFPSDYRPGVQNNMGYVAETLAQGGNPYTPPYPGFYSTAGGHLHGVAGAPFVWAINSTAAPRFGVLFMGLNSLLLFYSILKEIGVRTILASGTTFLLLIYPQFILFHTAGNPSAADIFFGLVAVFAYLQWRSKQTREWLVVSSLASGAAVFSHFYSGVVAIGLLTHYHLTTPQSVRQKVRAGAVYAAGMIPAGLLLIAYKVVFSHSDPKNHYMDRLLFNSFGSLYATERIFGTSFDVFSNRFIFTLLSQHGNVSPMFGRWWLVVIVVITLSLGWRATPTDQYNPVLLVLTWIVAGSLTAILVPGGVIYHEYYTWWLLLGVFVGIGWSFEMLLCSVSEDRNLTSGVVLLFPTVLTASLLWFSLTSPWTALVP